MNRIISKTRIIFLILITLFFSAFVSQASFAKSSLSEEDEAMFSQNNILFYEPCDLSDNGSGTEICGSNKNYAGAQVFTESQMQAIEANQPFYQKAADQFGIPWEVIAVIHKRESGLARSNPKNGQGVYQFASAERRASCKGGFFYAGKISDEQFQIQTNCAADAIKNSYGSGLDLNTDDGIKKMFFRYNGTAQAYIDQALRLGFSQSEAENGEGSPYVMNRYDEKREPSSSWGQIKRDYGSIEYPANNDFGAFTAYKALTCDGNSDASNDADDSDDVNSDDSSDEDAPSDSTTIGDNAKAISDAASKLAWPKKYGKEYYYEPNKNEGSHRYDAYVKAVEELGLEGHGHTIIPDCGDFVETVVKYSGYDKNFVQKLSYLKKKTKLWDIIEWDGKDASKLKAGDILYSNKSGNGNLEGHDSTGQHWWVITEIDNQLYTAEASLSAKTWGRIKKKVNKNYKPYQGKGYWIIRAKDDDSTKPSCDAKIQGSKNINGTGAALAWPLGTKSAKYTLATGKVLESVLTSPGQTDTFSGTGAGTTLFQEAWIKSGMSKNGMTEDTENGRYSWRYGAYCCGFTAVVARYSGYDEHFNGSLSSGGYEQVHYAEKHPDLWEVQKWDKQKSSLQGGDILVSAEHSWMIVEDESGELYRAEASLSSGAFGHISEYSGHASGTTYIIRAKNANNSNVGVSVTNGVKSSSTSGAVASSVQNSHDIGAVARYFAWPLGTEKSKYAHYPKEKEAWKTLLKNNGFTNFGQTNMGHDCGVFVSGVLRYAGLTNSMGKQGTPIIPNEVDNGENGWYKVDTDGTKESDLQDGDVIYYYNDSGHTDLRHFAIFLRDENGKPLLAEAGHDTKYGLITEFSTFGYMSVFRNRNNKTGSGSSNNNECSLCPTDDDSSGNNSGDGTIVEGGFKTKEEAQKIADAYNKADLSKISGMGDACGGNYHLNCVNFSKWFIHTYLKGMNIGFTGNGGDIADNFYKANKGKFPNLKESNVPVAYSIFSVRQTPGLSSSNEGHTGVILGINGGQVIFAEAAWCKFTGQVRTLPISSFTSGQYHKFIDVNAYINGGI